MPPSVAILISATAVLLSALAALFIGWRSNLNQKDIASRRATLDVLLKLETDRDYIASAGVFRDIRDSHGLEALVNPGSQLLQQSKIQVDKYLNFNELISIGVFTETLNEKMVYLWMRGSLIHDWHAAKEYVIQERAVINNPRMYAPFQALAEAWECGRFSVTENLSKEEIDDLLSPPLPK